MDPASRVKFVFWLRLLGAFLVLCLVIAWRLGERGDGAGSGGPMGPVVIAAAGDISCPQGPDGPTTCEDQATSDLLLQLHLNLVLLLGDNQYDHGRLADYNAYYDPTWGRLKSITKPAPGNHEYETQGASGYFTYFGSVAKGGYYSFDIGAWHVLSLDSEIDASPGSAQYQWAQADLSSHGGTTCVLAYWHKARWGSGGHFSDPSMTDMWNLLYDNGADLVLSGHNHQYERFAPLDKSGNIDTARGMREFVVGVGGKDFYSFGTPLKGSEKRDNTHYGVLKLVLRTASYDWKFIAAPSQSIIDSGTQACH